MYTAENYVIAQSLDEAYQLLKKSKRNRVVGGNCWMRMGKGSYQTLIDLSKLQLDEISESGEQIIIGAMTTLRQVETSELLRKNFGGVIAKSVEHIVGVSFRNTATMGASVYSKFGFSDIITALLALDTSVELYNGGVMPLEDFLNSDIKRDILVSIRVKKDGRKANYKTFRATKTDFGVLDVCVSKNRKNQYKVSVGARPGVAKRCEGAEACLNVNDLDGAKAAIKKMPYGSNIRGSEEYRRILSGVLLEKAVKAL